MAYTDSINVDRAYLLFKRLIDCRIYNPTVVTGAFLLSMIIPFILCNYKLGCFFEVLLSLILGSSGLNGCIKHVLKIVNVVR
jgi:hypothetical protein